jgi:hypothetical protein
MAAAKKVSDSLIAIELLKFEKKINEFFDYLDKSKLNKIEDLKEIDTQIKMIDALTRWLPILEKLRENEISKKMETRGDQEAGGAFKVL